MGAHAVHSALPAWSTFSFLWGMVLPLLECAFVFAMMEKVEKERFVVNQSNQMTRKLFGELISKSCAQVLVDQHGRINFHNASYVSLIKETLQYEELPANVFHLCAGDSQSME